MHMDPRDDMNMTRALEALAPYLNEPRKTVIRIEVFVVLAAAMMFLQLMLGPWRRRSGHWSVQGTLWIAYMFSFPLITYTLGQMMSSPVKNGLYPIWAILLFWTAGCTNAITAYSLEDNKQWKRYLFELIQYPVYLSFIFDLLTPIRRSSLLDELKVPLGSPQPADIPLGVLSILLFFTNLIRIIAGWRVTNSTASKLVADYMRVQVGARGAEEPSHPTTMGDCRYLVRPTHQADRLSEGLNTEEDSGITVKEIWDINDSLVSTQLKHVCVSFALSHLLRRRFFEMECAEAGLPETRKFALEILLPEEDSFHIIEVELGFLYDDFFTKYATLFHMEGSFLIMVVVNLVFLSVIEALFLLGYSPIIETLNPIIEVGTRRVDVAVTTVIMGALILMEALQVILYLTSDWATVSLACSYTRRGTRKLIPSVIWFVRIFKFGKFLDKLNLFGYWQNKMGQSSLIKSCLQVNIFYVPRRPMAKIINKYFFIRTYFNALMYIFGFIYSMIFSATKFEVVPDLVKDKIVSCLRRYSKLPLTNGEAALDRNGVLGEFSWTLENHSQTTVMLIWHIATEYCRIASSDEAEVHQRDRQVATTLSKYCAYLMSFLPELLPGNSTDTKFLLNDVLREGRKKLRKGKLSRDGLLEVINDSESSISTVAQDSITNNNEDSIFMKGLKLGRELEKMDDDLWRMLAEFWAETIIYIAPSDKVEVHMERLAQGGEFLTHIWALTHAGILKHDQKQTPEDIV